MISIVIPVYNAAPYIKRGLSWIKKIDSTKVEIIIIDDGSTDESGLILDNFSSGHNFISVFHTENQGASKARQYGMAKATGECLIFLDIDDEINDNLINIIESDLVHDIDLHVFSYDVEYENKIEHLLTQPKVYSKECIGDYLAEYVLNGKYGNGFLWNKIYKTAIAKQITFPPNLKYMEDEIFNLEYIPLCNSIVCHSESYYTYHIDNPGNSRQRASQQMFDAETIAIKYFMEFEHRFPPTTSITKKLYRTRLHNRISALIYYNVRKLIASAKVSDSINCNNIFNQLYNSPLIHIIRGGLELWLYKVCIKAKNLKGLSLVNNIFRALRKIKRLLKIVVKNERSSL